MKDKYNRKERYEETESGAEEKHRTGRTNYYERVSEKEKIVEIQINTIEKRT